MSFWCAKSIKCFASSPEIFIPSQENISKNLWTLWWNKQNIKKKCTIKNICKWERKNILNFSVKNMYFGLCMSVYLSCLYIVILVCFVTFKIFTLDKITFSPAIGRRRDGKYSNKTTTKRNNHDKYNITTRGKYSKFCVFHDEY